MAPVQKGDRIRILEDGWSGARVEAGDVLKVTGRLGSGVFVTESPRNPQAEGWWFADWHEGEGWERVVEQHP